MAWIFTSDGNYVNFNGGGNLWRLHKDSNCISWHWDDTGDLFFDVYDQEYTVKAENIADVVIDGVPLSVASDFPTAIRAVFTGLGSPATASYLVYTASYCLDEVDTITTGALTVGMIYTMFNYNAGDDFTNVAEVLKGTINTTNCVFRATGTTPTNYANGTLLVKAPMVTILENTVDENAFLYAANDQGSYVLRAIGAFPDEDKLVYPNWIDFKGPNTTMIPISGLSSIVGYYTAYRSGPDEIEMDLFDSTFTGTKWNVLFGNGNFFHDFKVYP